MINNSFVKISYHSVNAPFFFRRHGFVFDHGLLHGKDDKQTGNFMEVNIRKTRKTLPKRKQYSPAQTSVHMSTPQMCVR